MLVTILLTVASALSANALGINCAGSARCVRFSGAAKALTDAINEINPGEWYNNGQHIACSGKITEIGAICAFLQNTGGTNGAVIKNLAHYIPDHGCGACGSVPYYYPQGDNDVSHGELTFNYVANPCVSGQTRLC